MADNPMSDASFQAVMVRLNCVCNRGVHSTASFTVSCRIRSMAETIDLLDSYDLKVSMIGMAAFATSSNSIGCPWSILANAFTVFAKLCELKVSMIWNGRFGNLIDQHWMMMVHFAKRFKRVGLPVAKMSSSKDLHYFRLPGCWGIVIIVDH
eukprot:scaffold17166_cov113-Cylindrotheca_fusiformis.AAC.4